jgi:hypothetical protein
MKMKILRHFPNRTKCNDGKISFKKQVGEQYLIPDIPPDISISPSVFLLMKKCWDRDVSKRPTAKQFVDQALRIDHLYEQN